MCRLENTLQMRRISLGEGKLLCEVLERDSPCDRSRFARDFQQTVKSPGDWTAQRLILRRRKCDGTPRRDVLAQDRRDRRCARRQARTQSERETE